MNSPTWNDVIGANQWSCGCLQFRDGYEYCGKHTHYTQLTKAEKDEVVVSKQYAIWKTKDNKFYFLVKGTQGDWFKLPMTILTETEIQEGLVRE